MPIGEPVLERLLDTTRMLAGIQPQELLVQVIVERATSVFEAPGAALFLVDGDTVVLTAVSGGCAGLPIGLRIGRTRLAFRNVAVPGATTFVTVTDEPPQGLEDQRPALVVPLHAGKDVVGILWMRSRRPDALATTGQLALSMFAAQAGAALDTARQYRELAEAERRKDGQIATLAHELRNPLGAILNAVRVLERFGSDDAQAARLRDLIGRQTRHLTRLVDDVLDVARVRHGKLRLDHQPVDLREVVHQALDALRVSGRADDHDVRERLGSAPVVVDGDATRLEQVVRNLLDNAVKYSPAGTTIEVSIEPTEAEVVLRVRDQGIGIGPAMLPRLFEPFAQAERALKQDAGGLGLGLPLVRSIVEQHGGSITAHSDGVGRGSEFSVRLPVESAAP